MAIVGDRPSSGVRFALTRSADASGVACVYEGFAHTPDASFPVVARVAVDGSVDVTVSGAPDPKALAEKVRLLVRTAVRQAAADGDPPPLRITRWRGEK